MKNNDADLVRFQLDPANLPPLTEVQKAELTALEAIQESDIDFGDIPPAGEDFWRNAQRGLFYRPLKHQVTARLDADVLAWLKSQGKGYQARMNAILRQAMLAAARERNRG